MISSIITSTTCKEDEICNYCIKALEIMSENMGITYGQLNVYLFIIYLPLTLIVFMFLSVYNYKHKTIWNKKLTYFLIVFNILFGIYFLGSIPLI